MEYIVRRGKARTVISRFKAVRDELTDEIKAVQFKAIYRCIKGAPVLLWQVIRSCFGNGYWQNDMPWNNNDGWNNGL